MALAPFDFVLIGALLLCAVLGFWRGFVSEVLAIAAWVLAILLARAFAGDLAAHLVFLQEPLLRLILAFAVVVLAVLMVSGILRWMLRELLRAVGLGTLDRLLGASFGALKGLLIALLVVLAGGLSGVSQARWWREATLVPPLQSAVLAARPWLP